MSTILDDPNRVSFAKELFTPDSDYAAAKVAWLFGSLTLMLALAPIGWLWISPWTTLLIAPFVGAQSYKLTFVMHECAHNTLFASRELNHRLGIVTGWLLGTSFDTFARLHWRHHRFFGTGKDPQGPDYLGLDRADRKRLVWHLLRPILGLNLIKLGQFRPDLGDETSNARKRRVSLLVGIGTTQAMVLLIATGGLNVPWLALLYPVSAATFGLFFSQTRGFCEHYALPGNQPAGFVRTHLPNRFDQLFFYGFNFNYHVEHHLYPGVPCCHLPRVHAALKSKGVEFDQSPSIFATLRRSLVLT